MNKSISSSITAIIPAFNEEKNIERCMKSLLWCDKIQVLWMGSDNTKNIAKSYGAEVVKINSSDYPDFALVQKNINWAIDNATTDWILRVDADEVVTNGLKNEITEILNLNNKTQTAQPVAYGIPRSQYFIGGFLKGGDWAYDRLIRLFRPKYAKYDPIVAVHEQFKTSGIVGYLKNTLLHYSHPTLTDAINKFNIYTTLEAQELHDSFVNAFLKMIFVPWYVFARWVIWHKGYKDGTRGIIAGFLRGFYDFLLYAKYLLFHFSHSNNKSEPKRNPSN